MATGLTRGRHRMGPRSMTRTSGAAYKIPGSTSSAASENESSCAAR